MAKQSVQFKLDPAVLRKLDRLAHTHEQPSANLMARRLVLDAIERLEAGRDRDLAEFRAELLSLRVAVAEGFRTLMLELNEARPSDQRRSEHEIREWAEKRLFARKLDGGPSGS